MKDKKTLIATIIGVALLVVLVAGATFAYFTTAVTNDDGETLVTGKTDAIGSISLTNPTSNLHITLNALDMAQDNLNTYWATNDATLNYDSEEVQRDIAVAILTGGEATTYYECTTTINVSVSGTMVSGLQRGDAYIQFGGLLTDKVDLKNVSSTGYPVTFKLNGTDKVTDKVSASLAIVNRNANQNSIAGKELSVTFSNDDLQCKVVEGETEYIPSTEGNAFAIYSADDNSLRFYKNYDEVEVGDTYRDLKVTEIYTGFEVSTYDGPFSSNPAPWHEVREELETVIFVDKISPVSTAEWFPNLFSLNTIDLTNLDTSNVTTMRGMFTENAISEFIGIDKLDLSSVTDMSSMFAWGRIPDISGWDVSSVTDMSGMFSGCDTFPDISNWNTSNVTDMSYMFGEVYNDTGYTAENPLDLSGWDVSKVTNYSNFISIDEITPLGSIIPPNFN